MTSNRYDSCPALRVGLMSAREIDVVFISGFETLGHHHFSITTFTNPVLFTPTHDESIFEINGITIGVGFHWQQQQAQRFNGALELIPDNGSIVVINHVAVEQYLRSVISSEMNAESPLEFLKAHAVISRSWVLRQIVNREFKSHASDPDIISPVNDAGIANETEIIKWYDREDHTLFDVCADDHCQRYQGTTRLTTGIANEAVNATRGLVLMHDNGICDARFSKCCGGVTEEFGTCWADENHPYLKAFADILPLQPLPDLTTEYGARMWIMSRPEAFCNTYDPQLLSKVLNNFDQSTTDFYRWEVTATANEFAGLILEKSGIDIGELVDLVPLQRGPSGRIRLLKIVGTKRTIKVGKELEIRRLLSKSHLYSSAFIVEKSEKIENNGEKITTFTLYGAGWGHGVGLCQIGAAAMSCRGYDFKQILEHYYPGASIRKAYE